MYISGQEAIQHHLYFYNGILKLVPSLHGELDGIMSQLVSRLGHCQGLEVDALQHVGSTGTRHWGW